jgi:hypothetical protein
MRSRLGWDLIRGSEARTEHSKLDGALHLVSNFFFRSAPESVEFFGLLGTVAIINGFSLHKEGCSSSTNVIHMGAGVNNKKRNLFLFWVNKLGVSERQKSHVI